MISVARSARLRHRILTLVLSVIIVSLLCVASLFFGSNTLPFSCVWDVLSHSDTCSASTVVIDQRLPRTLLLVVVGAALGVAGSLMQSLTRNPLADPGILGVNAGASLAVVLCVAFLGNYGINAYLWSAFLGAAVAAVGVHMIAGAGGRGMTPARLALAGIAISMAIQSLVQTVILSNQNAFNEFRFWAAGSVEGRGYPVLQAVSAFVFIGLIIAFVLTPSLNALALGDETGRSLGVNVSRVRGFSLLSITLLSGSATAAAGPIMFIGLGVPSVVRALCGADQRWVLPITMILAPAVLLIADLFARVIVAPQELPVGVIAAIMGGPVFILLVRRKRIEAL